MRYSAKEISDLRSLVHLMNVIGGWSGRQADLDLKIESQLVTYMANETSVDELRAEIERLGDLEAQRRAA